MARFRVCDVEDIPLHEGRAFMLPDGRAIAVFRQGERLVAVENRCPHAGGVLHNGLIEGNILTCAWHGWQFELPGGKCRHTPDKHLIPVPLEQDGEAIFVTLTDTEGDAGL